MNIKHITLVFSLLLTVPVMAQKKSTAKADRKQASLPVYKQAALPLARSGLCCVPTHGHRRLWRQA